MAAQFAAEATLRRVHAAQKDEELPSLEAILYPLEAEIKLLKLEVLREGEREKEGKLISFNLESYTFSYFFHVCLYSTQSFRMTIEPWRG